MTSRVIDRATSRTEAGCMTSRTLPTRTSSDRSLRGALRLDAAASGALGLAGLLLAPTLGDLVGAPAPVVLGVGAFFVAFAASLLLLAARPVVPRPLAWTVVLGNAAWMIASVVVAALAPLTTAGVVVVLAQAAAVAVFAGLQRAGLRRAATAGA